MALTYGFYNSVAQDRVYNSVQISSIFNGIIMDGVYASIGQYLTVIASSGMNVYVRSGRAWFNNTWTYNDSNYLLTLSTASPVLPRYDAIVLEINSDIGVRANSFKVITGTPATVPVYPTLINTSTVHQYPLAYIYVDDGVTAILQGNITNMVGTTACPFVTGPLSFITTNDLLLKWEAEFIVWFDFMKGHLGTDPAGDLQLQIVDIVGDLNPPLINLLALKTHAHFNNEGNTIGSNGLATGAVTAGKIAVGGVSNSNQLIDYIITPNKLASLSVTPGKIATGGVSSSFELADNIVDDQKIGNRVMPFLRRVGGHATDWTFPGTTVYTPGLIRAYGGSHRWTGPATQSVDVSVYFPAGLGFTGFPLVFLQNIGGTGDITIVLEASNPTFFMVSIASDHGDLFTSFAFEWFAIGAE